MIQVTHFIRKPHSGAHSLERMFEDVRAKLPAEFQVMVCTSRFLSKHIFKRIFDIIYASVHQGQINHVTGDVHFLTYLLKRNHTVLTILDCVVLGRLSGFKKWFFWVLWYWIPEKKSKYITVISKAAGEEVQKYLKCDPNKIKLIYCNLSEEFKPNRKIFNNQRPRLLQIGTSPNKNIERLIVALTGLNICLVIVGSLSQNHLHSLTNAKIQFENMVNLSREDLLEQYNRCDMLVFASIYEGFGMPIIEANAVGRPVVTSNLWSMPEIAGAAACLVDPYNVDSVREGIVRVIADQEYREELILAGFENAKRFSIDTITNQYAEIYREIYRNLK